MKMGFEEPQSRYISGSQRARVWTERWVAEWVYCPNCGNPKVKQFPANLPVADFFCPSCGDQYELKSQKKKFGAKVADGAFKSKCERLLSSSNPNLLLLNYDLASASVRNVYVVPKHFFVLEIIEERKPLAPTARRAGWVGSNILLSHIPESGKILNEVAQIVCQGVKLETNLVVAELAARQPGPFDRVLAFLDRHYPDSLQIHGNRSQIAPPL